MPAFRRVDVQEAGPSAVGILVPPGLRTVVVVRPRAVPWDLRPARWNGDGTIAPVLCEFDRDEAATVARQLVTGLEKAVAAQRDPVEICGNAAREAFQVWVRIGTLVWIAGQRAPGQPYRPSVFTSEPEAVAVGEALLPYLWPTADAGQEFYFNTQLFETQSRAR